jgi:hypothetical protein
MGDADKAETWLTHVKKVYPDDADHIVDWLAYKVQRPADKINHTLVLGGSQGIGKDTLLEPVKHAVGQWNFIEISPKQMFGRFNSFAKSVILRISEARDLGDVDRFQFYEVMKVYSAAPPDVLRVDEKNLREYYSPNCCGPIVTANKKNSFYLPADDRRHFVAWSILTKEDFDESYWNQLWDWYNNGGLGHVVAYLAAVDLSAFDPKAPPPKTAAFWEIVNLSRAPEDAELTDAIDRLAEKIGKKDTQGEPIRPDALTVSLVADAVSANGARGSFYEWLTDRKNSRAIPHRLEDCGYVAVECKSRKDGRWRISGTLHVIYAKAELPIPNRYMAAEEFVKECEGNQAGRS